MCKKPATGKVKIFTKIYITNLQHTHSDIQTNEANSYRIITNHTIEKSTI